MNNNSKILQITKKVPILQPNDTIRRAAGLIRESGGSRIFVHDTGRILGYVTEKNIAQVVASAANPDDVLSNPIGPLIEMGVTTIDLNASITDAASLFASTDQDVMPVVDTMGNVYGYLYRRDVVANLTNNMRPPSVGGMATPLGVFLSTGSVTGGAGNLGLFLTGASLALMIGFSQYAVTWVEKLVAMLTGMPISAYIRSVPIGVMNWYDLPHYISSVLEIGLFLLMMRLSPLSGFHGAEHMTVHAIEAGESLEPELVKMMPRVHPRCGTNLLAGIGVFLIISSAFGTDNAVLIAILIAVTGWRIVGSWLQYFITTKTPNSTQLKSGIAAGNEVLDKYRKMPGYQAVGLQRIWNLGFIQTAAGVFFTAWILQHFFHISLG